jgi:hypothetical protein
VYQTYGENIYSGLTSYIDKDQLTEEIREGRVLQMFTEGKFGTFRPTFKVLKGQARSRYSSQRFPSWCDRVLYYAPHSRLHPIQLTDYKSCESITTSDHKPVLATFVTRAQFHPSRVEDSHGVASYTIMDIDISLLQCQELALQVYVSSQLGMNCSMTVDKRTEQVGVIAAPTISNSYILRIGTHPVSVPLWANNLHRITTCPVEVRVVGAQASIVGCGRGYIELDKNPFLVVPSEANITIQFDLFLGGLIVGSLKVSGILTWAKLGTALKERERAPTVFSSKTEIKTMWKSAARNSIVSANLPVMIPGLKVSPELEDSDSLIESPSASSAGSQSALSRSFGLGFSDGIDDDLAAVLAKANASISEMDSSQN